MATFDGAIKLLDFGIARATIRHQQTAPGIIKGKLDYLSPEQCEGGTIDAVTDIYSIGVLLFELITGTRPFWETDVARLFKLVSRGDRPRVRDLKPGTPTYLERIVDKAMATKKKQRYQSAQRLVDDLNTYLGTLPSAPTSTSVAGLMMELAPDKISNIANSYGPAETTAVQHVSLPESPLPAHETDLDALPTVANFNYEEALQPFTDDVDNERTQIDRSAPSALALETDLGDDQFEPRFDKGLERAYESDTVVEDSPVLSDVSPPPPSRTLLLVLALVALFSVAILAGILVTLSVRRGQASTNEHQELIQGTSTPNSETPPAPSQEQVEASTSPAATCQLLVRVIPPHAEVTVDEETRTADNGTVSFNVPPGPHEVRATTPDGQSSTRTVMVSEDEPMAITLTVGITKGRLSVRSRRRATVYVGQTKLGLAPIEGHELDPGEYTVRVKSRRGVRQRDVTIVAGQLEEIRFDW
jgi:serine/threonine protein kinase